MNALLNLFLLSAVAAAGTDQEQHFTKPLLRRGKATAHGANSTAAATGFVVTESADQGCPGLPANGIPPANSVGFSPTCAGARPGILCTAECQAGYRGAYLAVCKGTEWSHPSGACLPKKDAAAVIPQTAGALAAMAPAPTCSNNASSSSCYADPSICWGLPAGPNPPDPNSTFWSIAFATYDGGRVTAQCRGDFVGSLVSYCIQGNFTPVVGGCYRDPNKCWTPPDRGNLRIRDWPVSFSYEHGQAISTTCFDNAYDTSSPEIVSTCFAGKWTAPLGTCYADPRICPTAPADSPAAPNATDWPLVSNYFAGDALTAYCKSGYVGAVKAVCNPMMANRGNWSTTFGQCFKPRTEGTTNCRSRPSKMPANTASWNRYECSTSNGGFCRAACRPGFIGWAGAQCQNGVWSGPLGMCYRDTTTCPKKPSATPPNSNGWQDCARNEGSACMAVCKDGFIGNPVPVAFCQRGRWSTVQGACVVKTGTCSRYPTSLPANADYWDNCDAREGGLCHALCKPGWSGAPLTTCRAGVWQTVQGSCVPSTGYCPGQPPFNPPNTVGWEYYCNNIAEGSACIATCAPGYRGAVLSYCSSGKYTAAVGSCEEDTSVCLGLPPDVSGTDGWSIDNCNNQEGGVCFADCTAPGVGSVISQCSQGKWSTPVGSCWAPTGALCLSDPKVIPVSSKKTWLLYDKTKGSQPQARQACQRLGGDLATINSDAENTLLQQQMGAAGTIGYWGAWIGLRSKADVPSNNENDWIWLSTGQKPNYTNWYPTAPDNCCNGQEGICGHIWYGNFGQWNDLSCAEPLPFVCELAGSMITAPTTSPLPTVGPQAKAYGFDNCAGSIEGYVCQAFCIQGYIGGLYTTCNATGQWSPPAGRCYRDPQICAPPAGLSGNRSNSWPETNTYRDGSRTTTSCQYGYQGSYQAVCTGGSWSALSGGCYKADVAPTGLCFGPPPDSMRPPNSNWDWTCQYNAGMRHGEACQAVCNSNEGYVGSPVFYCNGNTSAWEAPPATVPNSCRLANSSCNYAALPAAPEGAFLNYLWPYQGPWGNCFSAGNAEEGRVCTALCPYGDAITMCKAGMWTPASGSCLAPPPVCTGQPSETPPNTYGWNAYDWYQTPEGRYITATCIYGFVGQVLSFCSNGKWQPAVGSCEPPRQVCRGVPAVALPANADSWSAYDWMILGEGEVVYAQCRNTFVGQPYSMCRNGTYMAAEGSCVADPAFCKGSPSTIPAGTYGWDCNNVPEGGLCRAGCAPGAKGDQVGVWISTCKSGVFTPATGSCRTRKNACVTGPTVSPSPYSNDFPDCSNTPDGGICQTDCLPGYDGYVVALCQGNNVWQGPIGSCRKPTGWKCYIPPTNPPGPNALDWPALSSPINIGNVLFAQCITGYVGQLAATCLGSNRWSAVRGSCIKRVTSCFGPPSVKPGPGSGSWGIPATQEYLDGAYVDGACLPGYAGRYVGICMRGAWSRTYGSCIKDPTICSGAPQSPGAGADDWPQYGALSHGQSIQTSCLGGYMGAVRVTCVMGNWTAPVGSCWRSSSLCTGPPSITPPYALDFPTYSPYYVGALVTASCKAGYKRDITNVCTQDGIFRDPACVNSANCLWPPNGGLLAPCGGFEYIYRDGDTLSSIAAGACEVPLANVVAVNPHIPDSTKICPGDSVCCPVCKLSTLPPALPNSRWANCSSLVSSGACAGTCNAGFVPDPTPPSSTCSGGLYTPATGGCVEACSIRIQLINAANRDMLVLTDVALIARAGTAIGSTNLVATMSSTNASFPVLNCLDNNNATRCSSTTSDAAPTLTLNYPCYRGLSAVRVINRKDCCQSSINRFKLVFVKSVNGTTAPEFLFTNGTGDFVVRGPNA